MDGLFHGKSQSKWIVHGLWMVYGKSQSKMWFYGARENLNVYDLRENLREIEAGEVLQISRPILGDVETFTILLYTFGGFLKWG